MSLVRIFSIVGWIAMAAMIYFYLRGKPYPALLPRWFFVVLALEAALIRFYEAF